MTREEAKHIIDSSEYFWLRSNDKEREALCMASKALEQEPRKGHWIEERNDYGEIEHWHCSNCYDDSGFTTTCKWNFCPNCGAEMEEVER